MTSSRLTLRHLQAVRPIPMSVPNDDEDVVGGSRRRWQVRLDQERGIAGTPAGPEVADGRIARVATRHAGGSPMP